MTKTHLQRTTQQDLFYGQIIRNNLLFCRDSNVLKTRNGIRNEKKHFSTKNVVDSDQKTFLNLTKSFDLNCSTSSYGGKSNSNVEEKTKFERKILVYKVCLYSLFTRVQLKIYILATFFCCFYNVFRQLHFSRNVYLGYPKNNPSFKLSQSLFSLSLSLSQYITT